MRTLFADTGYWIALLNPHDDLHPKATSLSRNLSPVHIVTTEMVWVEVLNDFCDRGTFFRQTAVNFVKRLDQHPNISIISQSKEQFQATLTLYEQRPDKEWSLTDCASFQIMQQRQIQQALAYDRHFEQAGFVALLR
jgi:uncharacterized protein